jgi:uncharacterized protein (TIGR03663 family)
VNKKYTNILFFIIILITGAALRLTSLSQRPMHTDEAVNSVKFSRLLEDGEYTYDKTEYHGPMIYYLTLIPAWITNTKEFAQLNEKHLRIIPASAGIGLLFLLFFIRNLAGWKIVLAGSLFGSLSPAVVFYSRYYIHEMLLVFFTYGFIISLYMFFKYKRYGWLVMSGVFLGSMHATKETFILSVVSLFIAFLVNHSLSRNKSISIGQLIRSIKWHDYIIFISIAGIISMLFFSSFLNNPHGIIDSIASYKSYFTKASENKIHQHQWYYYLRILTWNEGPGHIIWSELSILILSLFGGIRLCLKKEVDERIQFFRMVAIFSFILLLVYSFIPYKTPWNIISSYFGLVLLAGYGIVQLTEIFQKGWLRVAVWIILITTGFHLIVQVAYTSYKYVAHPSNPYVYGHTSTDIFQIVNRIREVSVFHSDGKDMNIHVICSENDYWPLPWYMRDFNYVGWWNKVDFESPLAPLIVVSPDLIEPLVRKMYTLPEPGEKYLYVPLFEGGAELRPGIKINAYVRKDFWNF